MVFSGIVLKIASNNTDDPEFARDLPYTVTFRVLKSWKGSARSELLVYTDNGLGGCGGTKFQIDEQHVVYVDDYEGKLDASTGCRRTRVIGPKNEESDKEIRQLNSRWFRVWSRIWLF